MPRSDTFVSVVAPLYNEGAWVEPFVRETVALLQEQYAHYELVLVDDGSTDDTVARVETLLRQLPAMRLIRLSRRFGPDIAITSGLESAIGDFVVTLLPETDPPSLIPGLVDLCRQGKDVLFGIRSSTRGEPWSRRFAASLFYAVAEHLFRAPILRHASFYQVYSRQALNAVVRIKDKARYLRLLGTLIGYENRTFTYEPIQRSATVQGRSWSEAFALALGLLTAQSANPLRFVSAMGLLASIINVLYVAYILVIYFFKPHVAEGWTTLSLQTAGLFLWVFLILTVLSEYVGQILGELKDRPLYFALEEKNSSVLVTHPERRNIVSASPE